MERFKKRKSFTVCVCVFHLERLKDTERMMRKVDVMIWEHEVQQTLNIPWEMVRLLCNYLYDDVCDDWEVRYDPVLRKTHEMGCGEFIAYFEDSTSALLRSKA
jgi:hypothetical protein